VGNPWVGALEESKKEGVTAMQLVKGVVVVVMMDEEYLRASAMVVSWT